MPNNDPPKCETTQVQSQVSVAGPCPEGSAGTYDEAADKCTVHACLEVDPNTINLAGAHRCEMLGMQTSSRFVSIDMPEEECTGYAGGYDDGKCKLFVCTSDTPLACTTDDTFTSSMTFDSQCDEFTPGSTNVADPTQCDVKSVCMRKDPGNPIRLHLIRPDLDCVRTDLKKGVESYEGEVLIGTLSQKECDERGGLYVAGQCRLDAVNKLTYGKCNEISIRGSKKSSTEMVGPIAGLDRASCEQAGGMYQENTGMCENATYCQVEDSGKNSCMNPILAWLENTSSFPLWITIASLVSIVFIIIIIMQYRVRKAAEKGRDFALAEASERHGRLREIGTIASSY